MLCSNPHASVRNEYIICIPKPGNVVPLLKRLLKPCYGLKAIMGLKPIVKALYPNNRNGKSSMRFW